MTRLERLLGVKPTILEKVEKNNSNFCLIGDLLREIKLINEFTGQYYKRCTGKAVFAEICKYLRKRKIKIFVLDDEDIPIQVLENMHLGKSVNKYNRCILLKLN